MPKKTRYRVCSETNELIANAVKHLKALERIPPLTVIDSTRARVEAKATIVPVRHKQIVPIVLPDVITFLQKETKLTRHTLMAILQELGRIGEFRRNQQRFMTLAAREIWLCGARAAAQRDSVRENRRRVLGNAALRGKHREGHNRYLKNLDEV